jgi:hypothetical protein
MEEEVVIEEGVVEQVYDPSALEKELQHLSYENINGKYSSSESSDEDGERSDNGGTSQKILAGDAALKQTKVCC